MLISLLISDDVKFSIKRLASVKSAGNDEFDKCATEIIAPFLCRLFNNILTTGMFPVHGLKVSSVLYI